MEQQYLTELAVYNRQKNSLNFRKECHQTFKELMPILPNSKTEKERTFPHLFYEARITLTPKLDEDMEKQKTKGQSISLII